ncbi:MAG: hypothetical protein KIG60_07350 [Caryophanon sp.]|nr:hypothetical protein [Caryophanon sp.]
MKKKLLVTATAAAAMFTLAACSETEQSAQEIFDKTMERQKELTSATANMDVSQVMTVDMDGETQEIKTATKGTMDMILSPLAMKMDADMTMDLMGETMEMPMDMYMTEDQGIFMQDPTSDAWMKLPSDQLDAVLESTDVQVDQTAQLEQLKEFVDDFTMEETDEDYVLTLNLNDEKFNSLIKDQAASALGDTGTTSDAEVLESMNVSDGMYKLTIDKETYDLTDLVMDFLMTMDVEGETMEMDTSSTISYTDFNHLTSIEIPQDIIDSAVDATNLQ